jgi:[protein-PII] uridylyltransferase
MSVQANETRVPAPPEPRRRGRAGAPAPLRDRRSIVDVRVLAAALDAVAESCDPSGPAARQRVVDLAKRTLAAGRTEIRRRFEEDGERGLTTAAATAWMMDQLIRALYHHTVERVYPLFNPTAGERLAVVAVGGYGRRQMAPYSDVDLLFLFPFRQTPWGEQVVEYLLYLLWDLGLKIGQATRSVDECLRLGRGDITIRTSLLEARYICGDTTVFRSLRRRFASEVVAETGRDFVEAKLTERDERHRRFGDSRYLVEPNVKEGKGGLRDLHTLFWIGKYVYRVPAVADLVDAGVLTTAELRRFRRSEEYLWTVRCHLHYMTDRAEERLTFDAQAEIGQRMRYVDRAGVRGVERFMKHYFLVAKEVGDLTRIFCASLEEQFKRKTRFRLPRLGQKRQEFEGFVIEGGRSDVAAPDLFRIEPRALIRLFHLAQRREADIHPRTLRLVTRSLGLIDHALREDPEANRLFMEILTSRRDPETTLRRMNEAGVLGRFMPDFGRVVAQMQHDMYHVYTVDEHTIRAVGMLARIERGELREDLPLSHTVIQTIESRPVLYLAVMLHDIAKGRGGDHSELGAEIAVRLGPRLGLGGDDTETVAWLVRHHLAMSSIAFKRDLQDPKTVADFAALVRSPERLKLLLILTVADIRAVGPKVWNGWKGQLLRDLYHRAEETMSGEASPERVRERVAAAQGALRERLPDWPEDAFSAYLGRGRDSYWLSTEIDTQVRQAEMVRAADSAGHKLAVEILSDAFRAISEVSVYAPDHPGLFASIAGAMAMAGVTIVEAKIFTTSDGMALDAFWVQDSGGRPLQEEADRRRLETAIADTLAGIVRPERTLAAAPRIPSRTSVFRVVPRVVVDNAASNINTVIEVTARDRRGLLFDVTRAIADLGLSIVSARVATYGETAVDVFYVKDIFGLKIAHEGKLQQVRERLQAAVAEVPSAAVRTAAP